MDHPRRMTRSDDDTTRFPARVEGDGLVLRLWRAEDAEAQGRVIAESIEHLRAWMPWIAHEPIPPAERRARIAGWEREWEAGGDAYLAVEHDGACIGSTGLHRRSGPGAVEIGYWLHPAHTGRGHATAVARLLTDAAFTVPSIDVVEIRHDVANVRSGAVPARLRFEVVREAPNGSPAPGDAGTDRTWAMTRARWAAGGLVSSDA
jgi:RimJ/RimL family protein N-acetyltransferase